MPAPEKRSSTAAMLSRQLSRINIQAASQINQVNQQSMSASGDFNDEKYDPLFTSPLNVALYGHNQFTLLRGHIDTAITQNLMPTSKSDLEPNVTFYPTLRNYPTELSPSNVGIQAPSPNSKLAVFICPMIDKNGAIVIDENIEKNMSGILAKKTEDRPPCFFVVPSDLAPDQVKAIEKSFPNFPVIKTDLMKEEFDMILGSGHTESEHQSKLAQLFNDLHDKLPKPAAEDTRENSSSVSVTPTLK